VVNKEVLRRVKEKNILHKIKRRRAYYIGHILRRNCLLKDAIEGKIMTGRRGRRRKHLLKELEEMRGYCKFREEARCEELALEEGMDLT
jgi:hypothetical protein